MVEIARTPCQWRATARRLDRRFPSYPEAAQRIRAKIWDTCCRDGHTLVSLTFNPEEAAVILARAPLSAWWMPASPVSLLPPREEAFVEAEEIIQEIFKTMPICPRVPGAAGKV